jgi:hypothetical protein
MNGSLMISATNIQAFINSACGRLVFFVLNGFAFLHGISWDSCHGAEERKYGANLVYGSSAKKGE